VKEKEEATEGETNGFFLKRRQLEGGTFIERKKSVKGARRGGRQLTGEGSGSHRWGEREIGNVPGEEGHKSPQIFLPGVRIVAIASERRRVIRKGKGKIGPLP